MRAQIGKPILRAPQLLFARLKFLWHAPFLDARVRQNESVVSE